MSRTDRIQAIDQKKDQLSCKQPLVGGFLLALLVCAFGVFAAKLRVSLVETRDLARLWRRMGLMLSAAMAYVCLGLMWTPGKRRLVRPVLKSALIAACAIAFAVSVRAQTGSSPDCQPIAWLPPMATFGGPSATAAGNTELGLGFGIYGEFLPNNCGHVGDQNAMMRFRRALTDRLDLGFDLLAGTQGGNTLGITPKAAVRYLLTPGLRLEGGIGAADGGGERNLNADVAAVLGTHDPAKTWNYYMSLRLAGSRGCLTCGTTTNHWPGALVPLGVIGTTARVSNNMNFVMEGGYGGIFVRQYSSPALYLHLSCGIQFNVGREHRGVTLKPSSTGGFKGGP